MITKFKIHILGAALGLLSCKKQPSPQQLPAQTFYKKDSVITPDDIKTITPQEAKTYHKDTHYQYEYRTGISGNYEYNYDVIGEDENGNEVAGNINTEGKLGAGILTNDDGEQINIKTEWIGYGKLKATDQDGNEYKLEVLDNQK
jgi:hypothetical protein